MDPATNTVSILLLCHNTFQHYLREVLPYTSFWAEMSFLIFLDEFEIHWATFSKVIEGKFTVETLSFHPEL